VNESRLGASLSSEPLEVDNTEPLPDMPGFSKMPDFVPKPDIMMKQFHLPIASSLQNERSISNQLGKYPYPKNLPPYRPSEVTRPVPFIERLRTQYNPKKNNQEPESIEEPEKHVAKQCLVARLREMSIERA
jgi:hypothetical protein